jgi:nucleotide-binding universal stress UspA family protein
MLIKRILIPIDFSEMSLQALDYAVELGKPFGAELVAVHVVEPIYYATPADVYGPSANLGMLLDEQQRVAAEQLAELEDRLMKRGDKIETVLDSGVPYQKIVEAAEQRKADLIIMATHGRTGLSHLLLGSVAERVVRSAACPVLTVRGHEGSQSAA